MAGGNKALSGELTTLRIKLSGSNTFDGGSINVQYDNPSLDLGSGVISGGVVQTVFTQDGEWATGTTKMVNDDTIPQNDEGVEFMTASITPTNAANLLKVEVLWTGSNSSASSLDVVVALFQDSIADALSVAWANKNTTANHRAQATIIYWMTAGTASSITFKVRAGSTVNGTTAMNGTSSAKYGGALHSSINITEYKV
jgi:hypothetical protein